MVQLSDEGRLSGYTTLARRRTVDGEAVEAARRHRGHGPARRWPLSGETTVASGGTVRVGKSGMSGCGQRSIYPICGQSCETCSSTLSSRSSKP